MKRHILILLLALSPALWAQQADSGALVVDRYLQRLHLDQLPADSMLCGESLIFTLGQPDTLVMRRWQAEPHRYRVELWQGGRLGLGLVSDGKTYHIYSERHRRWRITDQMDFLTQVRAYDMRGGLYKWQINGMEFTHLGTVLFRGQPCHRLLMRADRQWDRHYYFSQSDGMLFFIEELATSLDELPENMPRVDWRAISEYAPVGNTLLVGEECYQDAQGITVMRHSYSLRPIDPKLFQPK